MKPLNLIGYKSGQLTVIKKIEKENRPQKTAKRGEHWLCQCDCGNQVILYTNQITSGKTKSCGCLLKTKAASKVINEVGNKYGKLTVLERVYNEKDPTHAFWLCKCDCGKEVIVKGRNLRSGHTKSCGCLGETHIKIGDIFGKLTVVKKSTKQDGKGHYYWLCKCECGSIKEYFGKNLLSGNSTSCGCIHSKAEKEITKYLVNNNINFKKEFWFKDLKLIRPLRFDFAIFDKNNNLLGLIEYQGEQHYKNYKKMGKQQREITDPMKKEYCLNKSIPLFEIKYTENIALKLQEILSKLL